MTIESFLMIIAPLSLFIIGVLFIPNLMRINNPKSNVTYKLIDELEKKYIY